MAKKVFKEKLVQRLFWQYFVVALQIGEYMALCKLAHDYVPLDFLETKALAIKFRDPGSRKYE